MYMEKEEIIKKLNEIRKTRIIDIYAEEEFFGKGLIINKEGKTYIYNWCISLCIEENLAKEVYELEEYNIDISKINKAISISNKVKRIIKENLVFSIGVKILILVLSAIGIANMWQAVFADVGVTIISILNTLRIMKK